MGRDHQAKESQKAPLMPPTRKQSLPQVSCKMREVQFASLKGQEVDRLELALEMLHFTLYVGSRHHNLLYEATAGTHLIKVLLSLLVAFLQQLQYKDGAFKLCMELDN